MLVTLPENSKNSMILVMVSAMIGVCNVLHRLTYLNSGLTAGGAVFQGGCEIFGTFPSYER